MSSDSGAQWTLLKLTQVYITGLLLVHYHNVIRSCTMVEVFRMDYVSGKSILYSEESIWKFAEYFRLLKYIADIQSR